MLKDWRRSYLTLLLSGAILWPSILTPALSRANEALPTAITVAVHDLDSDESETGRALAAAITDAIDSALYQNPDVVWSTTHSLSDLEGFGRQAVDFSPATETGRKRLARYGFDYAVAGRAVISNGGELRVDLYRPTIAEPVWSDRRAISASDQVEGALRELLPRMLAKMALSNAQSFANRRWFHTEASMAAYGAGRILFRAGDSNDEVRLPKALAYYEMAASLEPEVADSHNSIGWVALASKDYLKAEMRFRRAVELAPNYFDAVWGLSKALTQIGQTDAAATIRASAQTSHGRHWDVLKNASTSAPGQRQQAAEEAVTRLRQRAGSNPYLIFLSLKHEKAFAESFASASLFSIQKRALQYSEKICGEECDRTVSIIDSMAKIKKNNFDYTEANLLYIRSLSIREKGLDPNHPDVALSLNNLAVLCDIQHQHAEAEFLYKRSLGIYERAYGPDHPDVASALNNLGSLYETLNRLAEAEALYKRSLAIREKADGPDHKNAAAVLNNLAHLYNSQGRRAEAEPLYKRSLAIREKANGSDHPSVALALDNLASLYETQNRHAEAEPLYKRSLAIREKADGSDHPSVARALDNLASLYETQNRHAEAEPLFERSLAIREKADGSDHPSVALALDNLASLYETQNRHAEAEPLFKRSLAIRERTLGPGHIDLATSADNLAYVYVKQGRAAEAEPLYKRSLAIRESTLGHEHSSVAKTLNSLANVYMMQGRVAEAEPLVKRSLVNKEKVLGPAHPEVAVEYSNLASVSLGLGRATEAERLAMRSLAIREKSLGSDHPDIAGSLNNLAAAYQAQGRHAEAESVYKRSLAICEKALGTSHPSVALAFNNLASVYVTQGRYTEAEQLNERSLALRIIAHGLDHPEVAMSFNNLARLYDAQGRTDMAEQFSNRSLATLEKALGPNHPDVATALNNLALHSRGQDRTAEAELLYKRSLAIWENSLGPDNPAVATSLNNLGTLYQDEGRNAEAESLFKRSLVIREKALGPEHPEVASSLYNLAAMYDIQGRQQQAVQLLQRALNIAMKSGEPVLSFTVHGKIADVQKKLGNKDASILFGKLAVNEIQYLRTNLSASNSKERAKFLSNKTNIYHHLASTLGEMGRIDEAQQVLAMLKEDEYFDFIRRDAGRGDPRVTRATLNAAESEALQQLQTVAPTNFNTALADVVQSLEAREGREAARLKVEAIKDHSGLRRQLGELFKGGAVLLEYVVGNDALTIFVTTANEKFARTVPVPAATVRTKVLALREVLVNARLDPVAPAREVYDLLLAPVADDLQKANATMLVVSLDDVLRYVPVAALHDGEGWVAQRYPVAVLASAAIANLATPPQAEWKVVGFGTTKGGDGLPPLAAVEDELKGIVKKSGTQGVLPGILALDDAFTGEAVKQAVAQGYPVLHMATHFVFRPDVGSYLMLGKGGQISLREINDETYSFDNVDLLTLSACETGKIGVDANGREVEGLGVAVQRAGAHSVLASLWPVADASTAVLMRRFYQLRDTSPGISKAEALRQAQIWLMTGRPLDEVERDIVRRGSPPPRQGDAAPQAKPYTADPGRPFAHPNFWAPFILMGNWL